MAICPVGRCLVRSVVNVLTLFIDFISTDFDTENTRNYEITQWA